MPVLAKWLLAVALAVLSIHSLAYGAASVADPAGMAQEFGAYEAPSEAAQNLTGLVGVFLLIMGMAAALGAYWMVRFACQEGVWVAAVLSAVTLVLGIYWAAVGRTWDAGFYSAAGASLGALAWWAMHDLRASRGLQTVDE